MALATHCANCGKPFPAFRWMKQYRHGSGDSPNLSVPPDCDPPPERELAPVIDWRAGEFERRIARAPVVKHWYEPFCTMRCALRFAQAAHRAGYRRKRDA